MAFRQYHHPQSHSLSTWAKGIDLSQGKALGVISFTIIPNLHMGPTNSRKVGWIKMAPIIRDPITLFSLKASFSAPNLSPWWWQYCLHWLRRICSQSIIGRKSPPPRRRETAGGDTKQNQLIFTLNLNTDLKTKSTLASLSL